MKTKKKNVVAIVALIFLLNTLHIFNCKFTVMGMENPELPGSEYRTLYGSNYWPTSNLREWLNSADEVVKYTCQPPSADKLGNNAYDMEPGFLSEFTAEERDAIAVTKHRVFISGVDGSVKTGGSISIPLSLISTNSLTFSIPNLVNNGLKYRYQEVLDKVYLLNTYELYVYVQQRGYDLKKSLMSAAKKKYSYYNDYISYWLCSSETSAYGEYLHAINTSGNIVSIQSPQSSLGVAPVINLKPDYRLSNGKLARELSIGEVVTFGRYLGEPIEWRVINIQDGYPMLWTEKAVTIKAFDTPGDISLAYSKYVDFSGFSYIDRSVPIYMAKDGGTDITPPSFTITNEDILFTRQNESFSLHFQVTDDSRVKGIILPNGKTITDTVFDYTFSQNGYYLFIAYDNSDNYRYFMVPVGNINVPATVEIKPSADGWTNKDVTVDIFATCDVGFELPERVQNNRDISYTAWTNYTTYAQKQIRVTGDVELISADKPVNDVSVGPGFGMTMIGKTEDGFYLYPTWIRATTIYLKTLQDEGKQHFDVIFEVPGNYFSNLYPWFQIGVSGLERSYTIRWSNVKYELLDKEDLQIEKIILPTGEEIIGQSSYRDILTEEGVYKYTVVDNRGMVYEKTVTVLIDKVPPVINISADKTHWTKDDVVLTVTATDNRSGIKELKLPNGSTTSNTSAVFNVRVNGDYVFEATDVAGNITRKTFRVSNIDKKAPTIIIYSAPPQSQEPQDSVVLTVIAQDEGSGIDRIELPDSTVVYAETATYTVTSNGNYVFKVYDKAGNELSKSFQVSNINHAPIAAFTVEPNPVLADEPVVYIDNSYDPEGKPITERIWTIRCLETNEVYEFINQNPPTIFQDTGWGINGDGTGTYEISLKVKDTSPNGIVEARWSDEYKQILVVEDPLKISELTLINIPNPPAGTVLPVNYPVTIPVKVKAGYRITFRINTNGGDKLDIKIYANGQPLTVYTDSGSTNVITINTARKNASTVFSFWTSRDLSRGTILDMKIILTRIQEDGIEKSIVNNELGEHFAVIVGSAKKDSSINLIR